MVNGVPYPQPKPLKDISKRANALGVLPNNICCMCLNLIQVQIFKNEGVCSEKCRKDRDNDHQPFRGGSLSP